MSKVDSAAEPCRQCGEHHKSSVARHYPDPKCPLYRRVTADFRALNDRYLAGDTSAELDAEREEAWLLMHDVVNRAGRSCVNCQFDRRCIHCRSPWLPRAAASWRRRYNQKDSQPHFRQVSCRLCEHKTRASTEMLAKVLAGGGAHRTALAFLRRGPEPTSHAMRFVAELTATLAGFSSTDTLLRWERLLSGAERLLTRAHDGENERWRRLSLQADISARKLTT